MDPTTIFGLSIVALIAAIGMKIKNQLRYQPDLVLIEQARLRAKQRANERRFVNTQSDEAEHDMYTIPFHMTNITVEDNVGDNPLTDEQVHTINVIVDEYNLITNHG